MPLIGRGISRAIKYELKRIDYVNPLNKLVSKYAPPGYRKTLFKVVKISEALLGGKTAYDIYQMMAPDSPGNELSIPFQKQRPAFTSRKPHKARLRRTVCYNGRYSRQSNYRSRNRYTRSR